MPNGTEKQASSEIAQSRYKFTQVDAASIIKAELGYTNGWAISEKKFSEHCYSAAQRILAAAERDTRERVANLVKLVLIQVTGPDGFLVNPAELEELLAERIRGKE
jgi:hypothetical protein